MQSVISAAAQGTADLHSEVLHKLRMLILDGEFLPGSRIVERAVCERLAVSRTPLREAFKVLAAEGLIELLPNRGARVAEFSEQDTRDAFQVLATLESLAGMLAAVRASDDEIAEVRALHYQMHAHFLRRELPQYFELNRAIHWRIVKLSGNAPLDHHLGMLTRRVAHARYAAFCWTETFWVHAMKEHEDILDALVRRDGTRLGQLLHDHLMNKLAAVIEGFRRNADGENADGKAERIVLPLRRPRAGS